MSSPTPFGDSKEEMHPIAHVCAYPCPQDEDLASISDKAGVALQH